MASKEVPLIERTQSSYAQLSHAATNLNTASDQLDNAISVLEAALQKLNLGISAWAPISASDDDGSGYFWSRDVGYTQSKGKWGIALRTISGNYTDPEDHSETVWPFNEAPRWMRVEAVGKIPDLLDKLVAQAVDTTKKLKGKTAQAHELAVAINEVSEKQDDWQAKLQSAMTETGLTASADAIATAEVGMAKNELTIRASTQHRQALSPEEIGIALQHLGHPDLRFKVLFVKYKDAKKAGEQPAQEGKQ